MTPMTGPYRVEQVESPQGAARWRLVGPGMGQTRAYPWPEFRDKLGELADLMNFAYRQGQRHPRPVGAAPSAPAAHDPSVAAPEDGQS